MSRRLSFLLAVAIAACGSDPDAPSVLPPVDASMPNSEVTFDPAIRFAGDVAGPGFVAIGDTNGDGVNDLVFAFGPRYAVFLGRTDGTLAAREDRSLDQDDATDVATSGAGVGVGVLQEFGATLVIDEAGVQRTFDAPGPVAVLKAADIDGDGDDDFVAHVGDAVIVYNPREGARARVELPNAGPPAFLDIGDVDGDGALDLVANGPAGSLYVAIAGSPGDFDRARAFDALNPVTLDAVIGDFDDDGASDIAVTGVDRVRVLVQTTSAPLSFAPTDHDIVLGAPAAGADIDGDGHRDLVGATADGVRIALRDPSDATRMFVHAVLGDGPGDVAVGDLNGDGRVDVAVADGTGASVYLQTPR